ncbi:SH3 domain-containing protein [Pseudoroseicyclus sp. CXY001]|uniref:SH3 domain-containing protein n=1 Tax=Pseudoroseicyclus sp. CXY001 TaxID=3242492 RepID=UPI00357147DF
MSRRATGCGLLLALALLAAPAGAELRPVARPADLTGPIAAPEASLAPTDIAVTPEARPAELGSGAGAEDAPALASADPAQRLGPVTHLPLPRFVTLKTSEGNVRRGPSLTHRIDWVFVRRGMPLMVTAEYGHWRRVEDVEGFGGWVHYALISGTRNVLVEEDHAPLHRRPDASSPEVAELEEGVIARLEECTRDWCRLSVSGFRGWAEKSALWGVFPEEVLD